MIVDIPNVGPVEFPEGMSQEEINAAAKKLYDEANKPRVTEKESPEVFGGIGASAGAIGAAGDIIFSKGRPLFRGGEKLFGIPEDPNLKVKPRVYSSPAEVAERAIQLRTPVDPDLATKSYMGSGQFTQDGKPVYYGTGETGEYSGARKAAAEAIASEKKFPGMKAMQGDVPLSLPKDVASQVEAQRAEEARIRDAQNQREVNRMAQMRAERLNERTRLKNLANRGQMVRGSQTVATKAGAPIIGGYELGAQGAQAYNRLTREDLQPSDVAAGVTNVAGAGLGGAAMLPGGKYRLPKALGSVGLNYLSDLLDVRNPRKSVLEEEEKKPEMKKGGLVALAKGGKTAAWQRKEGKSPSGGLNAKGRASYKRETGGELKPPQPEGGSRKKSFCARMGGMKKKLTSSKTANDPDSRINKALRKWKC